MGSAGAFRSSHALPRACVPSYDRGRGRVAVGRSCLRINLHVRGQYASRRSSQLSLFGCRFLPTRWRRIVIVALWRHKSLTRGRARGAHHVVFEEGLIIDVLEAHVQRLTDNDFVVGLKPHAFRRKFDAIIAELGLESLGLTPASLRAGGATERHLQREPIADISWLLRHADLATTRHYIQSAAAMLALARVPAFAAVAVETYARDSRRALRHLCRGPPPPVVVVKRSRARSAPAVSRGAGVA